MGDRTYTSYNFHKYHLKKMMVDLNAKDEKDLADNLCSEDVEIEGDEVKIYDYEANYGSIESLESYLQSNHIEYDKRWEAGGDYEAGDEFARNVNGEYKVHELSDKGFEVLTHLKEFQETIDQNCTFEELKKNIKDKLNLIEPFEITPLKLPNSIDFIKNA